MSLPLDAANYISLLLGTASQKSRKHWLSWINK